MQKQILIVQELIEGISLREFREFLIVNNICGETDFNYIEEKSKLL